MVKIYSITGILDVFHFNFQNLTKWYLELASIVEFVCFFGRIHFKKLFLFHKMRCVNPDYANYKHHMLASTIITKVPSMTVIRNLFFFLLAGRKCTFTALYGRKTTPVY